MRLGFSFTKCRFSQARASFYRFVIIRGGQGHHASPAWMAAKEHRRWLKAAPVQGPPRAAAPWSSLVRWLPSNPARIRSLGSGWTDGAGHLGAWRGVLISGTPLTAEAPRVFVLFITTRRDRAR
jgi:hypothetical protein